MQIYLSAAPQELRNALRYRCTPAHVAYRIGPESTLLRGTLPIQIRGGLLSLSDWEAPPIQKPDHLAGAVVQECLRRSFSGAVLDFEAQPRPDRQQFASVLARSLLRIKRQLFVPEAYAGGAEGAVPLLNTALSGGSYEAYLREKAVPGRMPALDVQRLAMDFTLPEPRGEGTPLSPADLAQRLERRPCVFFSPELCARYFTYSDKDHTHFVLFDDAGTLLQKLRIATAQGYQAAFFMYPEVQDLLAQLLPPR